MLYAKPRTEKEKQKQSLDRGQVLHPRRLDKWRHFHKEYNWMKKAKHEMKKFRDADETPVGWLQHLAKNFKQMCVRGENNEDRCDRNFFVLVIK